MDGSWFEFLELFFENSSGLSSNGALLDSPSVADEPDPVRLHGVRAAAEGAHEQEQLAAARVGLQDLDRQLELVAVLTRRRRLACERDVELRRRSAHRDVA